MATKALITRKMRTRTQMLLTGAVTITLGFAITIGVLSWQSSREQKSLAENYLQQIAQSQALQIQQELSYARDVAHNLGHSLIALPAAGIDLLQPVGKGICHIEHLIPGIGIFFTGKRHLLFTFSDYNIFGFDCHDAPH